MMAMPKIISLFKADTYEQTFPNISILGHKVDFFLECSSYDVILPVTVRSENKLDVFEEAVLKFIDFKCSSVEEMANILCLTPDLINFIIIRLQEMNFIEKNQKDLTNQGKKYIDESVKINNYEEIKFEQIKVFVLKETGEILPFVHQGKLITESIKDLQDSMLTVEYKTIDNVIQVRGKILRDNRCIKKE